MSLDNNHITISIRNIMEDVEVIKLHNLDKSQTYRIKPDWKEHYFSFLLFLENSSSYLADILPDYLQQLAEQRSQNVDDYYKHIRQYITQPDPDILFDVNYQSNECAEFLIKRKTGKRTVLFFSTKLDKIDFQKSVFNLIDLLLKQNKLLSKNLEECKYKQNQLENEKQATLNKLDEFIKMKTNWEQEMYSGFLLVLNEKKKRIKFLTDLLDRQKINPNEIMKNVECASKPSLPNVVPIPQKLEVISDSDSSSEYETDKDQSDNDDNVMDDDDDNHDNNDSIEVGPKPSTSKQTLKLDEEPSQILCLPKIIKKPKGKQLLQKKKQDVEPISTILKEDTQTIQDVSTQEQERCLSTQELIDRM